MTLIHLPNQRVTYREDGIGHVYISMVLREVDGKQTIDLVTSYAPDIFQAGLITKFQCDKVLYTVRLTDLLDKLGKIKKEKPQDGPEKRNAAHEGT